jgi:hypothetical protein
MVVDDAALLHGAAAEFGNGFGTEREPANSKYHYHSLQLQLLARVCRARVAWELNSKGQILSSLEINVISCHPCLESG